MYTLSHFSIVEKIVFRPFYILFPLLSIVFGGSIHAQEKISISEMPLRDKYAFIAWQMEKKGSLRYEMVNSEEFIDFSAMLLRDVFPEKRDGLASLLKSNDNEFGKKMFLDSIASLVQLLKPTPFGKHYEVSCEGILADYDFSANRFLVYLDAINKKFLGGDYQLFREDVNLLKFRYKPAENIPIPFVFYERSVPSYNDKFSLYSKGWHYINLSPESAQKIIEKITLNNPDKTRRIYARINYSPVEYDNRLIATDVIKISYYADAAFTDLILSYPAEKTIGSTITASENKNAPSNPRFAELPFLRKLNEENDEVRFAIYQGKIISENEELNGKDCYHSVLLQKYQKNAQDNYVQILALKNNQNNLGNIPTSIYWIQIGSDNPPVWVEGFRGIELTENGTFGKKIGNGNEMVVNAPKFMDKFEFTVIGIDKQKYSGAIDKLLIIFDKKGNEIATCKLTPISGDLTKEPINEHLMFKK